MPEMTITEAERNLDAFLAPLLAAKDAIRVAAQSEDRLARAHAELVQRRVDVDAEIATKRREVETLDGKITAARAELERTLVAERQRLTDEIVNLTSQVDRLKVARDDESRLRREDAAAHTVRLGEWKREAEEKKRALDLEVEQYGRSAAARRAEIDVELVKAREVLEGVRTEQRRLRAELKAAAEIEA